jgi:hypothetical protein
LDSPKTPLLNVNNGAFMSGFFAESVARNEQKSVEWYTPKWIFDELMVNFDLDPCSPHDMKTAVPALTKYTIFDDGLKKDWFGRVWLNPPYGRETNLWIDKMINHGDGIALVFSRTDAKWCQYALKKATAVLFLSGRIEFIPGHENKHKKSRCGAGTIMFAFGDDNAAALKRMSDLGVYFNNSSRCYSEKQFSLI